MCCVFTVLALAPVAWAQETILHSFSMGGPYGCQAPLVQASDGNFYGTTAAGGPYDRGTVIRLTPAGVVTVIHSFAGANTDGAGPESGLVQATDGKLYGTAFSGGAYDQGAIYSITTSGTEALIYSFTGGDDGGNPAAGLIQDSANGLLYGAASSAGANSAGTLFQISLSGSFQTLYTFGSVSPDGQGLYDTLLLGQDGALYGVTRFGGQYGCGAAFKVTTSGAYRLLHSFGASATDGQQPEGALVQAGSALYGACAYGGVNSVGCVYSLTTAGSVSLVYSFTGGSDGANPAAGPVQGSDGLLYGSASSGAVGGTVFRVSTGGAFQLLHGFSGGATDGAYPLAALAPSTGGALYGVTSQGGPTESGAAFQVTTGGGYSVVGLLDGGSPDGAYPLGALVQSADGSLLAAVWSGGAADYGAIARMQPDGAEALLHSFGRTGKDAGKPASGLILASDGAYYGAAPFGGAGGWGALYRMTAAGKVTLLHSFQPADGVQPNAGLVEASDGALYGTTENGGSNSFGTVFRVTPGGGFSVVHSFTGADGSHPACGLTQASDGNLYGMTEGGGSGYGVVFRLSLSGAYGVVHPFTGADGDLPVAGGLVQGTDGALYGVTYYGGQYGKGVAFQLTLGGVYTLLHSFSGYSSDGAYPDATLIQGSDGNLYGTTFGGGANGSGAAYRLTPAGAAAVLYSFAGGFADGADPAGPLLQGGNGLLYGTTEYGGATGVGTLFSLDEGLPPLTVSSVSPAVVNAGGPAWTLKVKGGGFAKGDTVEWNGAPLTTSYFSASQLSATVPPAADAAPQEALISVVTSAGGVSDRRWLTVVPTTIKVVSAQLSRDPSTGTITAQITLQNSGYLAASAVQITLATLNKKTSTGLPYSVGSIGGGSSAVATLAFPGSAGSSGQAVMLAVGGAFDGGTFKGSLKVTLP